MPVSIATVVEGSEHEKNNAHAVAEEGLLSSFFSSIQVVFLKPYGVLAWAGSWPSSTDDRIAVNLVLIHGGTLRPCLRQALRRSLVMQKTEGFNLIVYRSCYLMVGRKA